MTTQERAAMEQEAPLLASAYFDGRTYDPAHDQERLNTQLWRVFSLMRDGEWRTLGEIAAAIGGSEAGVSARLRDLRKERFGRHQVERRRRGDEARGCFEYQMEAR
jgi:hypothetical protein